MPADPFTAPPVGEIPTQDASTRNNDCYPKPSTSPQQQHPSPPQPQTYSPSPPTSTSASTPTTPLHQHFLNKVHTPLSPSTPPLTPRNESATRSKSVSPRKQVLELGQNAFYFTCEVPKRGSPRKTPSPKKSESVQMRPTSPDKSTGRVKDILRRNLFGAPAAKVGGAGRGGGDGGAGVGKGVKSPGRISPTRASPTRVSPMRMGMPSRQIARNAEKDGSTTLDERKEDNRDDKKNDRGMLNDDAGTNQPEPSNLTEPVTEVPLAAEMATPRSSELPKEPICSEPALSQDPSPSRQPTTDMADTTAPSADLSTSQQQTAKPTPHEVATGISTESCAPQTYGIVQTPSAFRSDIGALMANLKTRTPNERKPADVGGVEGMPTPLRKASEKLFGKNAQPIDSNWKSYDLSMKENEQPEKARKTVLSPTPIGDESLGPERSDKPEQTSVRTRIGRAPLTPTSGPKRPQSMFLDRTPWSQLPAGGSSSSHSRSGFAKTTNPGTPDRVRSSIEKEMDQMRKSLHTSLGSGTNSAKSGSVVNSPTTRSKVETPCLKPKTSDGNGHTKQSEKAKGNRPVSQIVSRPQSAFAKYAARKADNDEPAKQTVRATQSPTKSRPQSMVIAPAPSAGTVRGPRLQPSERQPSERKTVTTRPKSMVILPAPARTEVVVRTTKAAALRQKAAQAIVPKNVQPGTRAAITKEPDTSRDVPPRQRTQALDTKGAPPRLVPRKPVTSTRSAVPTAVATPSGRKTPSTAPTPPPKSPSKPYLVSRKPVPPPSTVANSKRTATSAINTSRPNHQPRLRVASAEQIVDQIAQWHNEDRKKATPPKSRPAQRAKAPITPQKRPSSPTKRHLEDSINEEKSYTPLGLPTKLRAPAPSPVKSRPTATAAATSPMATATKSLAAHPVAALRAPKTPVHRTGAAGPGGAAVGRTTFDPNALRTPSKEIQSALDRAIDAKIAEDARSGREFTPSGNRISDLLARRMG